MYSIERRAEGCTVEAEPYTELDLAAEKLRLTCPGADSPEHSMA